jgi:hypothetical protein
VAHLTRPRVRETSTTTGTGNFTLAGAVSGYQSFAGAGYANGDTAWYCIANRDVAEWEEGLGTWNTGGTLSRATPLRSSNAGALVNFSAGTKDVFVVLAAERTLQLNNALAVPVPAAASQPSDPAAGFLNLYARSRAGRIVPCFIGPTGGAACIQAALWSARVAAITPQRTTGINTLSCGVQTSATLSHPALASGSLAESIYRTRFQTSTTAGNASGVRSELLASRGNGGTLRGGFFFAARFCSGSISLAGAQQLIGLQGSNAALGGEPSALTNLLAVGKDIADTQWQFMRNDGSGTAVKASTGLTIANNQTLELYVYTAPGGSDVFVLVQSIANNGTPTVLLDTSYNTDIPGTTNFLAMHCQVRNGATAAAANIELAYAYLESGF